MNHMCVCVCVYVCIRISQEVSVRNLYIPDMVCQSSKIELSNCVLLLLLHQIEYTTLVKSLLLLVEKFRNTLLLFYVQEAQWIFHWFPLACFSRTPYGCGFRVFNHLLVCRMGNLTSLSLSLFRPYHLFISIVKLVVQMAVVTHKMLVREVHSFCSKKNRLFHRFCINLRDFMWHFLNVTVFE